MVTDQQVRRLMRLIQTERTLGLAAAKAGMDEKTARKYRERGRLPSQCRPERTWRTRGDPFVQVWPGVLEKLELDSGLQAKTLFADLQREHPGAFPEGQLRTLQRRLKVWRALKGPPKEVFFPQEHTPGELCQSDFTCMNELGVTIGGEPFPHLVYHFVLTYSNWETGEVCFSESFESLSTGLQDALWTLGGVPGCHQVDQLTAAVNNRCHREEFTARYAALLRHYDLEGRKIEVGKANQNGDVEQRHHRLKAAVDQQLRLRGSRDFGGRQEYDEFLRRLFAELNSGRRERFQEELRVLKRLPQLRLDDWKRLDVTVRPSSTIRVQGNVYSLNSRLIGEKVTVRIYAERLEVWYAQQCVETLPRLRGRGGHRVEYRHIIDWLVRKPGAFERYEYRDGLFPTHRFRLAYDSLGRDRPLHASREYLEILLLAAKESESGVDRALGLLIDRGEPIAKEAVEAVLRSDSPSADVRHVEVDAVDLASYDALLSGEEVAA
jgi:hypothetical protein